MAVNDKSVSIIVPVYNVEEYINGSIQSILNQTYGNIEVVLVDDGSEDSSADICKAFAESDGRVVYHRKQNAGVSSARNCGIELARGYYVMFVDSDDTVKPDCVERLVESIEEAQADLCICGYDVLTDSGKTSIPAPDDTLTGKVNITEYFSEHFLKGVTSSVCAKLYKKDLISSGFDTDITMGEDILFNLEYFRSISKCRLIPDCLYMYNQQNPSSLVKNYKEIYFVQNKSVCAAWLNWMDETGLDKSLKTNVYKRISEALVNYIIYVVTHGKTKDSVKAIKETLDDTVYEAVSGSAVCFNTVWKIMLGLYAKKRYTALVRYVKIYLLSRRLVFSPFK